MTWQELEREAREQVTAELDAAYNTPLVVGEHVVWSECTNRRTRILSPVHRVGDRQHGADYSACGEPIPPPVRRMPLSPALIRTMRHCKFCDAEMDRRAQENAA